MGERHVAHAQGVKGPQHAQRIVDGVPALHADQRGNLSLLANAHNVVGGQGQFEHIRVGLDQAVDHVDLFEGLADGSFFLGGARIHVGRPELGADVAGPQAGNVGMQRRLRLGNVDLLEGDLLAPAVLVGQVVMAIDDQGFAVQPLGFLG